MSYKLKVSPALPIEHRHQIQDLLKSQGYDVHGAGQDVDGSECDITFDSKKRGPFGGNNPLQNRGVDMNKVEGADETSKTS